LNKFGFDAMSVLHGITTTGFEAQDGFVPYFGVF
jgi:hypothetical protein